MERRFTLGTRLNKVVVVRELCLEKKRVLERGG